MAEHGKVATRQPKGGVITADRLNILIDKHNQEVRGAGMGARVMPVPGAAVQRFIVTAVKADHLECKAVNTLGGVQNLPLDAADVVRVMKPYKLRRTPFDGETIASEGVDITYVYAGNTTRNADDGTNDEDQYVTPSYDVKSAAYQGDEILAIYVGTSPGYEVDGAPVVWHELNTDGRAWSAE